jgi:hypothetical protein
MAAKNGNGSNGTKTTTKRTSKRPPAATSSTNGEHAVVETRSPSRDEIARRAFELYLARGGEHGRAQEDWLTAERELRERYSVS